MDDILDFVVSTEDLGKPANADLASGLATAPILYASLEFPELVPLIERKFSYAGDVDIAKDLVNKSRGIEKSNKLAARLCNEAAVSISKLDDSPARNALIQLTQSLLTRRK